MRLHCACACCLGIHAYCCCTCSWHSSSICIVSYPLCAINARLLLHGPIAPLPRAQRLETPLRKKLQMVFQRHRQIELNWLHYPSYTICFTISFFLPSVIKPSFLVDLQICIRSSGALRIKSPQTYMKMIVLRTTYYSSRRFGCCMCTSLQAMYPESICHGVQYCVKSSAIDKAPYWLKKITKLQETW